MPQEGCFLTQEHDMTEGFSSLGISMEEGTGGITGPWAQMEIFSSVSGADFDSASCTVRAAVSYQSLAGWLQAPSMTNLPCPGLEAAIPSPGSPRLGDMVITSTQGPCEVSMV